VGTLFLKVKTQALPYLLALLVALVQLVVYLLVVWLASMHLS
jgi:hypothetical protein